MAESNKSKMKIGGFSEDHLLKRCKELVEEKSTGSVVFDEEAEGRIPKFHTSELHLGRVLGRGGFCAVSEITKVTLKESSNTTNNNNNDSAIASESTPASSKNKKSSSDDHHIGSIVQDRKFMASHCIRNGEDARYALKILKDDVVKDAHTFVNGVVDLAIEARFLAVVRHPNIIKMRAVSDGTPYSRDYFVVLDRLYDILTRRITWWAKRKITGFKKLLDRKGKKKIAFWLERITVAYDLACALKYLHGLNIIYRDLKPDNIGFDVRGDVKIFDFGLAKEISPDSQSKDGTYNLTGDTGSPRYMAPEVALDKSYNETVDVYSFGILLWQLCAMETPFDGYTLKMFEKKIVRGNCRPMCDPKWPKTITDLMRSCWSPNIKTRPSMEEVAGILRDEISDKCDDEINDLMDASRKSEMSLHNKYN